MDYLFENLGDERFQEFCHSIISNKYLHVQAFPVGQPDGGRDSIVYLSLKGKKEFIVFQVKYVRDPSRVEDPHKWLVDVIDGESEKIKKLIALGGRGYFLITNVRGTGHLLTGSIDKMNKVFEENDIPGVCWWRSDLIGFVDSDALLKWNYPEIMNGQDMLNYSLFNNLQENKERRESVVRAYLIDQYNSDNEVKFKQIELQNRLLDLFTDVPIRVKKYDERNARLRRVITSIEDTFRKASIENEFNNADEKNSMGAAEFLLSQKAQNDIKKILLEGGPGQGKSTISQYICQVHRVKLLDKHDDIRLIPDNVKCIPVRLPFKIDLRHIALWVEKRNPYQEDLSDELFLNIWAKSLESFLIGHLFYHSKIRDFSISDFIAICRISPVLFVFDGFDEIADLNVRKDVIELINKGINRLTENCKSIQVLITSRPAAFSDAISFSTEDYPHFELTDITINIIKEYLEKWIRARRLESKDAAQIRRLVEEKMKMPHLRDLAKSPMQLAIFISLLRTRGDSLPNKRTALYDSYIELFFNRESEKSTLVRDQRDLIIEIHKYLAWVLHSEAELYKNSGVIDVADLKIKLNNYLLKEGHQTDITDDLFMALQERVCALVSRIQGTYEFEVQPLREYFCAKYLYETAPYSPVGNNSKGTKPDRFDAISRSYYWQNVVRFFAGCFDKGELPMLIDKLKALQRDEYLKYTNYPRILTSQLLSDYVFTQYPTSLKDVLGIILDGIGIGSILNQERIFDYYEPILLPDPCGRKEVVLECFEKLKSFPGNEYADELLNIIINNPYDVVNIWQNMLNEIDDSNIILWLEYAYRLGVVRSINVDVLLRILNNVNISKIEVLKILINARRVDVLKAQGDLKGLVLDAILNGDIVYPLRFNNEDSLSVLGFLVQPYIYTILLSGDGVNSSLMDQVSKVFRYKRSDALKFEFEVNDVVDEKVNMLFKLVEPIINNGYYVWRNELAPWDELIEIIRVNIGDYWILKVISLIGAGIKGDRGLGCRGYDLDDVSISICSRSRCARNNSGNLKYWSRQINVSNDIEYVLLSIFSWATPKVILELSDLLSQKMNSLKVEDLNRVAAGVRSVAIVSEYKQVYKRFYKDNIKSIDMPVLVKYFIGIRFGDEDSVEFVYENVGDELSYMQGVDENKMRYMIMRYLNNPENEVYLKSVRDMYLRNKNLTIKFHYYIYDRSMLYAKIPYELAKNIMSECISYPRIISSIAERICRVKAIEKVGKVGEIAEKEEWFK